MKQLRILFLLTVFTCLLAGWNSLQARIPGSPVTVKHYHTNDGLLNETGNKSFFQPAREQVTIRWIAKALTRMGEAKMAKRLMDDYFIKKRIHFGDISASDGNAETGLGPDAVNEITFPESMLNVADLDRLLKVKPYGNSSPLIGHALTVMHEYIHMDHRYIINPFPCSPS